jgi:hypothetical protein
MKAKNEIISYAFMSWHASENHPGRGNRWIAFPDGEIVIPGIGRIPQAAFAYEPMLPDGKPDTRTLPARFSICRTPGHGVEVVVEPPEVKWSYVLRKSDGSFEVIGDVSLWAAEELPPTYQVAQVR